tara:strand:- start:1560 stop:2396 length:837 start_codon:yes stop_codon:yes gene_type:complete
MRIFRSIKKFIDSEVKIDSFIPTMGNLHNGHLSLIAESKKNFEKSCVSIYINEKQFTEAKDFENYPKTIEEDIKKLEKTKVNYLLIPDRQDIENFSKPFDVNLEPKKITTEMCGKYRPGHFLAVIDIVHRFLQIIKPKNIILGEKDYQQVVAIKELINIYNYNIDVITSPTVRNKNGLALSSRNNLLLDHDKKFACDIYHALLSAKIMFENNIPIDQIIDNVNKLFINSHVNIEYFTIRDVKTLQHSYDNDLIALVAGHIGGVRLIDNMVIKSSHNIK